MLVKKISSGIHLNFVDLYAELDVFNGLLEALIESGHPCLIMLVVVLVEFL